MADLTVVCGNHVIIFSDKLIKFNESIDINTAWLRWYNKAVLASAKQLKRAKGWIMRHPDRIFFDNKCANAACLFDNIDQDLEIHLVAVANGAASPCIRHFEGGSGSLIVRPSENVKKPELFSIGNPGGESEFIHVFNEANLNIVLQELDTLGDLLSYLRAREKVFSNDSLLYAASEEDLLAFFLTDINEKGDHDFVVTSRQSLRGDKKFLIDEGLYNSYITRPEYKRKKKADKKSYLWDRMIERFSTNLNNGTLVPIPEEMSEFDGRHGGAEIGLRYMALQPRVVRRAHVSAILGAFKSLSKAKADRFSRAMLPDSESGDGTGFFIILLNRKGVLSSWTEEEYRRYRSLLCYAYAQNLLMRRRDLLRVVGIATEGELGSGRSEDLIFQSQLVWDEDIERKTYDLANKFNVFSNVSEQKFSEDEYPKTELGLRGGYAPIPYRFFEPPRLDDRHSIVGNRAQRRAQKSRNRQTSARGKRRR
ncbi:hypothetical protein [Novosphingobium marinum]|uniref:Uncharacterized protein n=1 Tax=Novosphingobium marinum TaxID=1514948 RepID=A0A7Y9XVR1_9SPHN|nr:hypothetical protein [Novosphingobium marinum]NYH95365.1 hypothetical protein [Novosphingobium marinum]